MKKNLLILLCAVFLTGITAWAGKRIEASALPQKAQTFLSTHFKGINIIKAEQDRDLFGTDYEVDLDNGAEVKFDGNGEWTNVRVKRQNEFQQGLHAKWICKKGIPCSHSRNRR